MADYRSEDPDGGFKKTFVAIAAVHLILLGGLLVVALFQSKKNNEAVVWMNPGSFGGTSSAADSQAASSRESLSAPSEERHPENTPEAPAETDQPEETPQPTPPAAAATQSPLAEQSELPVSTPRPSPTLTPRPTVEPTRKSTPQPTPRPTPWPTPKATPKPTPKPTPTATPKPSPLRTATSKSSPRPKSSPVKAVKNEKPNSSPGSADQGTEASKGKVKDSHAQTSTESPSRSRTGGGTGPGDTQGSGSGNSALAGYVGILTNRFQAAWNQPTGEMALGKMLAVTVKLKIESDGTVTEFNIIEGSGNAVVDDSVREAGKKITKLPPPPDGEAFSAPVRFELGN